MKIMKTVFPDYYDEFKCIADKCKHSCCIGWEIDIDQESLLLYREHNGILKERFSECISYDEVPHFILSDGERCPFLNSSNLCDIYSEMGEKSLCQICTDHPRFRNYYSDFTEIGLGLCCEEACRIILSRTKRFSLIGEDDITCNEYEANFLNLRQRLFDSIQDREVPFESRAEKMFEVLGIKLKTCDLAFIFNNLEYMDKDISRYINVNEKEPLQDIILENLCMYFLFRHLADSLDDGRLAERTVFAYVSVKVIENMCKSPDLNEIIECARIFSSEIEYSEENVENILERISDIILIC